MARRPGGWLQARTFLVCDEVQDFEKAAEPRSEWTVHRVRESYRTSPPFPGLPGSESFIPFTLFAQLVGLAEKPREARLTVRLQRWGDPNRPVCVYEFLTHTFERGKIVHVALPLLAPPISVAGWYEFDLILEGKVLARAEVWLTP